MIERSKEFGPLKVVIGSTGITGNDSSDHYIRFENLHGFIWDAEVIKTDNETLSVSVCFQGDYEFEKMLEAMVFVGNKMIDIQKI